MTISGQALADTMAGSEFGEAVQAPRFLADANSIFYSDKLRTTGNPEAETDRALLAKLGLRTRAEVGAIGCGECSGQ